MWIAHIQRRSDCWVIIIESTLPPYVLWRHVVGCSSKSIAPVMSYLGNARALQWGWATTVKYIFWIETSFAQMQLPLYAYVFPDLKEKSLCADKRNNRVPYAWSLDARYENMGHRRTTVNIGSTLRIVFVKFGNWKVCCYFSFLFFLTSFLFAAGATEFSTCHFSYKTSKLTESQLNHSGMNCLVLFGIVRVSLSEIWYNKGHCKLYCFLLLFFCPWPCSS